MPTLSYPGVYVQEVPGGVKPLDTASTSTAAFVGLAERGPDTGPTLVTSWTGFQRTYGSFIADGFLAHSVFQYFNNGGRQCYIVRVIRSNATVASVTVNNRAAIAGFTFSAKNKGAWGNTLLLQIEDGTLDPGNLFKLSVRRQDNASVLPDDPLGIVPLEVFDNLSSDPGSPDYVVGVVGQGSALVDVQVLPANAASLQHGVHRGGVNPVLPLNTNLSFRINVDGDGLQTVTLPTAAGTTTALTDVRDAIQAAVRLLVKKKTSTDPAAFTTFACSVETVGAQSRLVLQSGTGTATSSVAVQPAAANVASIQLKLGDGGGGRIRRPGRDQRDELQQRLPAAGPRDRLQPARGAGGEHPGDGRSRHGLRRQPAAAGRLLHR